MEFKTIPGYEGYEVSRCGIVRSIERDIVLKQYVLNGYHIVDTFRGSLTETLPVHRAVALAWIENDDPTKVVVNHIDGIPSNNWYENLEWATYSWNNHHAVLNDLRNDNIECKVRDFETGDVISFKSMARAKEFMGLRKDAALHSVRPKMFGRLISDRYEFRYKDDPTPWFYEGRSERIKPSRYMVQVIYSDMSVKEIYSRKSLLKEFRLYNSKVTSIPELAKLAIEQNPEMVIIVLDSYHQDMCRVKRNTRPSNIQPIRAVNGDETIKFTSLSKCASYFGVDRSSISNRLDKPKDLNGWLFSSVCPLTV